MSASDDEIIMTDTLDDPSRFGEIFDRYFATIHAYLTRRLDRSRADDLTGEVFRIAFDTRTRYNADLGGVRPWLYGIANNVLRRHLRDGERADRAWARLPIPAHTDDIGQVDEQLDAWRHTTLLQEALDQLRPTDREALVLFAVEELTYSEVAIVMGTPIGTVRSRISRARAQLRSHLELVPAPTIEHEGATDHG